MSRIAVGNADIADAQPLSDQQFYVLGKSVGTTNLSVYGHDNRLLAVVDVVVGVDVEAAKAAIHSLLPGEKIEVRAVNDAIALTFVKVLDEITLGLVDEDEPIAEPTTRESWEAKASKKTLTETDELLKLVKEVQPKAALNYNKHYISHNNN